METKDLILRKAVFEDWPAIWRNVWSRAETADGVWSNPHNGRRCLLKCFEKERDA